MTKIYPETRYIDMNDLNNANTENNNNNSNNKKGRRKSTLPSCDHLINGFLYNPGISSIKDEPYAHPRVSSTSIANGRRLLVTGKSLNLPAQEFIEDITRCFSTSDTLYIRKTKDITYGLMGFQVTSGYEVLNEQKMRICLLGLVDTYLSGFQFIIVNPYGVDAYTYRQFFCKPGVIQGPGITCPLRIFTLCSIMNFSSKANWFQLDLGYTVPLGPLCGLPNESEDEEDFGFTQGAKSKRVIAKLSRDRKMEVGASGTLRIDFKSTVSPDDRIVLFSSSLYVFYYYFIARGRLSFMGSTLIKVSFWSTVLILILIFVMHW